MEVQYIMHKGKEKKLYYCAECKFKSTNVSRYKAHVHSNKHIYNLTGDSNYQTPVIQRSKDQIIKRLIEENKQLKEEIKRTTEYQNKYILPVVNICLNYVKNKKLDDESNLNLERISKDLDENKK
tara:strand:- start:182 stop:556 length:375 start_codon:yes stop_codon:yes gene_type:complete